MTTPTRRDRVRRLYDAVYRLYGKPERWVEATRRRLKEHRISQGMLARKAGVDPSHLSKWIGTNRTTTPSIENMLLVDEAMFELIELTAGPEVLEEELAEVIR